MSELFQNRILRLREYLKNPNDAAFITNEVNIGYFTGFFRSEGYLLVTGESAFLLVDFRYHEAAKNKARGCEVVCFNSVSESVKEIVSKSGIKHICAEAGNLTVNRYSFWKKKLAEVNAELAADGSLDKHIEAIRIVKDKTELEKIASAQKIAERAYLQMLGEVRPGVTERELAVRLEYYMKRLGAEDISFNLITIAGKKTSLPHGVPSDNTIRDGDFLTCDFGAVYEGYHSDTTRTVAVGSATDEMKEIYGTVLKAQLAALDIIKPGVPCSEVDKTARDIIKAAGHGDHFGHSTGHGVGLDIHESPFVSAKSKEILKEGMVITDEPGIYLPGKFGVRIEDMVCVTADGYHNFVDLPKELIII